MRHVLTLLALMVAAPAAAQSPQVWNGATFVENGKSLRAVDLNAALTWAILQANKAGTVNGSTAPDTGVATGYNGVTPGSIDCPTSTQRSTSMLCIRGAASPGTARQPYLVNVNLDVYSGAVADPVALYAGARVHSGGTQAWALNSVTHMEPGALGGIGYELDLNNWACEFSTSGCSLANDPVGLFINGSSPYASGPAILVNGVSTANAQWKQGLAILGTSGAGVVRDFTIHTATNAITDYKIEGNHSVSIIDMANASAPVAMRIKPGMALLWTDGSNNQLVNANTSSIYLGNGAFNYMQISATQAVIAVPMVINADTTIAGQVNMNGKVVQSQSTPTSSTPCIAGERASDLNYIYFCASTNHWKRIAGSDF